MDYRDFEVRVGKLTDRGYPIVVVESPAGNAQGLVSPGVLASALGAGLRLAGHARSREIVAVRREAFDAPSATVVRDLGEELFGALLGGDVFACYQTSLALASEQGKGLRLRLRIDAPELAALPWEFLFDPKLARDHVALSTRTPLVRHLEAMHGVPLVLEPPIHVLGMVGAGDGLDVEREKADLLRAVDSLVDKTDLTLDWVDGNDWRSLTRKLDAGRYHVFHFIGHGGFDAERGEGILLMRHEDGTSTHELPATDLARLLSDHGSIRLVVLNSCEGARASGEELVSSTGAYLAARGIPAVVSMQFEISDDAALEFSRTFYNALAGARPVDESVSRARSAIRLAQRDTWEWATPVLHMRSPDGHLFHFEHRQGLFAANAPRAPVAPPVVAPLPDSAQKALDILRDQVKEFWVDGVLAHALARLARLRIDIQSVGGDVRSLWAGMFDSPTESRRLDDPRTMASLFQEYGSSLLVLGEPGSGKTVSLLELAADLIRATTAVPTRPLPVVFNLASWGAEGLPLAAWLEQELSVKHQIPTRASRAWIAQGRLLPLLDGLDEVAEARRAACVEAINTWMATARSGAVICCRLKEYVALPNRLALNGAIRLQPLDSDEVLSMLSGAGARLEGLLALLHRDSALLHDARSPLMLSLMVSAFEGVPVAEIADERGLDLASRRRAIMQAFVDRSFRRVHGGGARGR